MVMDNDDNVVSFYLIRHNSVLGKQRDVIFVCPGFQNKNAKQCGE
jgi:hypothetical protein